MNTLPDVTTTNANITTKLTANAAYFGLDPWVDVKSFGAKGNGTTDDTAAIDAAFSATGGKKTLFFPPGTYKYSGAGFDGQGIRIFGSGYQNTTILLADGKYLVDANQNIASLHIHGLNISGGGGGIRNRSTVVSTNQMKATVDHCRFVGFTGAAISDNSADHAYWNITNNVFYPNTNNTTTMCIALAGDVSGSLIANNDFLDYRVAIKLGRSVTMMIRNNDFLHFGSGSDRHGIWIMPYTYPSSWYGGCVVQIHNNRFGNENADHTTDNEILFAAESTTGTYFGDRLWTTVDTLTGWGGIDMNDNYVNGASPRTTPIVMSYLSRIAGSSITNTHLDGAVPTYVVQYDSGAIPASYESGVVYVGDVYNSFWQGVAGARDIPQISNDPKSVRYVGSATYGAETTPGYANTQRGTASAAGYADLMAPPATGWTVSAGSSVGIVDSAGGTDAVEITTTGASSIQAQPVALAMQAGVPTWIEFDAKQGATNPLTTLNFQISNGSSYKQIAFNITLGTGWRRYRYQYTPRVTETQYLVFNAASAGSVDLGQIHVYSGYDPVCGNILSGNISAKGSLTSTGAITSGGALTANTSIITSPLNTATASNNYSASPLKLQSSYWNGSASATHTWTMQAVPGSGASPDNQLVLTPSGSSSILFHTLSGSGLYMDTNNSAGVPAITVTGGASGGAAIYLGSPTNPRDVTMKYNAGDRTFNFKVQGGSTGASGYTVSVPITASGTLALTSALPLSATSASFGGSSIAAGASTSTTVTVTGATTAMAVIASPVVDPGDAFEIKAYVSAAATVTIKLINRTSLAATPTASTYNVRVIQ